MNLTEYLDALRPLAATHATANGDRVGFFMVEATRALGSLATASNVLAVLLAEGLVNSEPVVIDDDVHTLYRLAGVAPPSVH